MIRRGFWLAVGAAGGIATYRRVSSLGRQVSETLGARPASPGGKKRHWARESIRFTRDVREGMDVYTDRQRARSAPTLSPSTRAPTPRDSIDEREDR